MHTLEVISKTRKESKTAILGFVSYEGYLCFFWVDQKALSGSRQELPFSMFQKLIFEFHMNFQPPNQYKIQTFLKQMQHNSQVFLPPGSSQSLSLPRLELFVYIESDVCASMEVCVHGCSCMCVHACRGVCILFESRVLLQHFLGINMYAKDINMYSNVSVTGS